MWRRACRGKKRAPFDFYQVNYVVDEHIRCFIQVLRSLEEPRFEVGTFFCGYKRHDTEYFGGADDGVSRLCEGA